MYIPTLDEQSQDLPPSTYGEENVRDSVVVVDDFETVNHEEL